ncbi:unnamed protein product [Chrysoparadoxa australica]
MDRDQGLGFRRGYATGLLRLQAAILRFSYTYHLTCPFHQSRPREVYVSAIDPQGRVWASALYGEPGYITLKPGSNILSLNKPQSWAGDGFLDGVRTAGSAVGMLLMNQATRKRYRINAHTMEESGTARLQICMAMGNCPKYISHREVLSVEPRPSHIPVSVSTSLTEAQEAWIRASDSFILGTAAPSKNGYGFSADANNRGGNPGWINVPDARTITFPDYAGNNLYLSLGNIQSYGHAGLLFIDRSNGNVLQVTGQARVVWASDGNSKRVEISIVEVRQALGASPLRMKLNSLSEFNPLLPMAQGAPAHKLKIVEVVQAARGVKHFRLRCESSELKFKPGQYATFQFSPTDCKSCQPPGLKETITRSWTITSPPGSRVMEITVQAKHGGHISAWMHEHLEKGHELSLGGIGGQFTIKDVLGSSGGNILLLSAGIGITPMAAALRTLRSEAFDSKDNISVVAVHASRELLDVPFLRELTEAAASQKSTLLHVVLSGSGEGITPATEGSVRRGRITKDLLLELVPDVAERTVMMCGPGGFMDNMVSKQTYDAIAHHLTSARSSTLAIVRSSCHEALDPKSSSQRSLYLLKVQSSHP